MPPVQLFHVSEVRLVPPFQIKLYSIVQFAAHPSFATTLPSSHSS